jgi:CDP-glucose 4,6-dehydratase
MDFLLGKRINQLNGPILVTGHTGFKGTWLTLLLEKMGVPVVGLSLPPTEGSLYTRLIRQEKIPEVFGDIRNLATVAATFERFQPSAVIHMAAQPLVIQSYETPIDTFEINVMGTVNVLDTAIKCKSVKGVIAVTTDKVYRNEESGRKFIESDPLSGRDPYSASKVGSEAAIAAWQQLSDGIDGPQIVAVRAGNVIGGGDWSSNRLMPDLIKGFSLNKHVEIRNPSSTRPWQHALDPIHGYLKSLEAILDGDCRSAYNFGPLEKSLNVGEVAEIARRSWFEKVEVVLGKNESKAKEATLLELDPTLAMEELGWKPAWNQIEAVESTVNWWAEHLNNGTKADVLCEKDLEDFTRRLKRL